MVDTHEQTRLSEVVCAVLMEMRTALAEVPKMVEGDEKARAALRRCCGHLQHSVYTLAGLDVPVAHALAEVQGDLAALSEERGFFLTDWEVEDTDEHDTDAAS